MKKNNIITGVISSETTPIATIAGSLNTVTNNFVLENIATIENIQDYYRNPTSIKNPSITIYIGSDAINLIGEVADEFLNELFFRDEVNINKLISDSGVSVSISPCQPESKAALDCILGRTMVFGDPVVPTATKTYSSAKTQNSRGKRASLIIFDDAINTKHICYTCSVCEQSVDSYLDIFTFDDGDYICRSCCNNLTDHALGNTIITGEKESMRLKASLEQGVSDSFRLYAHLVIIENMLEKLKSIEYVSQLQQIDIDTIIDTFVSDPLMQAELLLAHSVTQLAPTDSSDINSSSINGSDINSSKVESTSTSELSYMAAEMKKAFSDTDTTGWKAETDKTDKTDKIDKFTQSVNAATIILNALDQIKAANTSITELQNTLVELSNTVHLISKIDDYDVLYEALDTLSTKGSRAALEDVAKKMNEKK